VRKDRGPRATRGLAGLFGPRSITWKINRESVLFLGGGRALLLQIAHPLVAAGVAAHSDFKTDPLGRLQRTLGAVQTITFGTTAEARRAYQRVDTVHGGVKGRLAGADAGLDAGTRYAARDPELLFWVHATLVDTALTVYDRYVARLEPLERERYYAESRRTARLFRIPESLIPEDLASFERYMEGMLADGGPIRVGDTARDIAASILRPPIAYVPSRVFDPLNLVTIGLLPDRLRREFGLEWTPARRLLFDASGVAVRNLLPLLPDLVRSMPPARAAERRVANLGK
jgi:uncharacterized protein (DUF2236 family)